MFCRSGQEVVSPGARIPAEDTILADGSHPEPLGPGSPVAQPLLPVEPAAQHADAHPALVCGGESLTIEDQL